MTIRVAHLLDGRFFGGAEQMVRLLAAHSHRVDVEASVYCLSEGRLSEFLEGAGIRTRVFASGGKFDLRPMRAMARAAREDGIQILQAHTSRTHLIARLLSRKLGVPNITTIQSPIASDENQGARRHPLRARIERMGRPWTDLICPVSREETERLVREEGAPPEKVVWIPNGIEDSRIEFDKPHPKDFRGDLSSLLARADQPGDAFVIAMIAALRPRKGPEVLIRAFGKFAADGGQGVLVFIGDDEFTGLRRYLDELKDLARAEGVERTVVFTGFRSDPWAVARHADLIALTSLFGEGLPLTLLEAMNFARPIAASDSQGNRECVVHGETGWLHPPGDAAALAGHLRQAAADRVALRGMGLRGRKIFLEKFELGQVLRQWKAVYDKLVPVKAGS